MAENSKISWTDHTFNPWLGCTRVSAGCENCYAENLMATRFKRVQWGPKGYRSKTSEATWRKVFRWNRVAERTGTRARVFCASLADVFDDHDSILIEWRYELWDMIARTRNLDWLLLTKRPENWPLYLPVTEPEPPFDHVRLGVSIEDASVVAARFPPLQFANAIGWETFVSYEPAIGPVDWEPFLRAGCDWFICGEESGPGRRPFDDDWPRDLRDQCAAYGASFHYKQRIIDGKKVENPELDGRTWTEYPGITI